ncbi:uncharacterized protein LOC134536497 [Bacillus rossius redtenbacheri]|uniref:uncharacterized protein LOC134536497 n=1 Tax=Bacillus rossius redtenbacheri TaxID=93214 RepID=UPI002FDCB0BB
MADWQLPSRAFVREFLQLYRSLPALWQVSCRDYKDRAAKTLAYDAMVAKLREMVPGATADCVRRRINILRTNFRKEMKKCVEAEKRGGRYTPRLWYYGDLLFLRDQGALRDLHEGKADTHPQVRCVDQAELGLPAPQYRLSPVDVKSEAVLAEELEPLASPRAPEVDADEEQDEEQDEEALARHVAAKLRRLDPLQRIFAEKLMHEVLFEAQLGTLTRAARVVVEPPP